MLEEKFCKKKKKEKGNVLGSWLVDLCLKLLLCWWNNKKLISSHTKKGKTKVLKNVKAWVSEEALDFT